MYFIPCTTQKIARAKKKNIGLKYISQRHTASDSVSVYSVIYINEPVISPISAAVENNIFTHIRGTVF